MLIGIPESDMVALNPHKMRAKELTLQNCRRSNNTLDDCIALTANDNALERLVTHRLPLESVQQGLHMVSTYADGVVKCVIMNDRQ